MKLFPINTNTATPPDPKICISPNVRERVSGTLSEIRQTVRLLNAHQSDKSVQSDLSCRHYMMNMVRPWHKAFFVWPWSEGHSELQTASQGGSKWPKGSHQKKEKPNLCSTMAHANDGNPATPAPPCPQRESPVRSSEV